MLTVILDETEVANAIMLKIEGAQGQDPICPQDGCRACETI
jgi:hypothetical protein